MQRGLLPDVPPTFVGYEFAAKSVPARFVGGDFYDFKTLSAGEVAIIIGDVSGKGVSAALHMARLIGDFRYACEDDPAPDAILRSINARLCENARGGMFATAVCLHVDCDNHVVRLANAGHHPLLSRDDEGQIVQLAHASGPPLGVVEESVYDLETHFMSGRQILLLYTDGVSEARNEHRREYGLDRLHNLFAAHHGGPEALLNAIERAVGDFAGMSSRFDDLTLLAFARMPGEEPRL